METTATESFATHHADMVHDAQLDYYGKLLATCSSDRTIKIFEVGRGQPRHICDITGHEGPVWQVAYCLILPCFKSDVICFVGRFLGVILNLASFLLLVHMIEQFVFGGKIPRKLNGIAFTFVVK